MQYQGLGKHSCWVHSSSGLLQYDRWGFTQQVQYPAVAPAAAVGGLLALMVGALSDDQSQQPCRG